MPRIDPRIAVLALATFASGTEAYVYAGLLSDMAGELRVDLGRAGLLATAFAVTYALLAPPLASVTARLPRRPVLVLGLAALGVINLVAALALDFAWLVASRVACGVVAALVGPSASAAAASLVPPEQRGRAMATVAAGMSLAFTLGVPLGSAVGGVWGWRATFVFAGLLLLACAAAIRLVLPPVAGGETAGLRTLGVARAPAVWPRLAVTALAFAASFSSVAYLGPVANAVAGAQGFGVGLFQACIGLGSAVGVLAGGRLADRPGRDRYLPRLLGVVVLTQLGYVAAQTLPWPPVAAGALLALAIFCGAAVLFATMPIVQVGLIEAAPRQRNVVLALNGSMIFLGQGLGAAIGGTVIGVDRLAHTGFAGSALAALLATSIVLTRSRRLPFVEGARR